MLGFVFSTTKRLTTEEFVRSFKERLLRSARNDKSETPILVGVITDPNSEEGKTAIKLAREGVLDAVQFHGITPPADADYAHYCAARIGEESDFDKVTALRSHGEPRILLDAKVEGIPGGTGKTIPESLCNVDDMSKYMKKEPGYPHKYQVDNDEEFYPCLSDMLGVEIEY